jgi:hypothetical protein
MKESVYMKAVKSRIKSVEQFLDINTAIAYERERTWLSKEERRVRDRATRLRRRNMKALSSIVWKTGASDREQKLFERLREKYPWL